MNTLCLLFIHPRAQNLISLSAFKARRELALENVALRQQAAGNRRGRLRAMLADLKTPAADRHARLAPAGREDPGAVRLRLPAQHQARAIESLHELGFLDRGENVIFLGPPGVGTTHLAISLAIAAAESGRRVYYSTLAGLIESLMDAKAAGQLSRRLRVLTHPALLVVDEIGYLPVNRDGTVLFFQLINARHELASTVLTSNKGFEEWGSVLGDEVMAAALDRPSAAPLSYRQHSRQQLPHAGAPEPDAVRVRSRSRGSRTLTAMSCESATRGGLHSAPSAQTNTDERNHRKSVTFAWKPSTKVCSFRLPLTELKRSPLDRDRHKRYRGSPCAHSRRARKHQRAVWPLCQRV